MPRSIYKQSESEEFAHLIGVKRLDLARLGTGPTSAGRTGASLAENRGRESRIGVGISEQSGFLKHLYTRVT